jgi:hypothetical protein
MAVQELTLGCGDVKNRVVLAYYILKDIRPKEQYMTDIIYKCIQETLEKVSKDGPLTSNNQVIRDAYKQTAKKIIEKHTIF